MSKSLKRILKIRQLVEDQSRLRLESAARTLSEVELSIESWHKRGFVSREFAHEAVIKQDNETRIAAEFEGELAKWRAEKLLPVREQCQQRVMECRAEFLEHRKLTMQTSSLLDKMKAEADAERLKKEQQSLDEWFQTERLRVQTEEERRKERQDS